MKFVLLITLHRRYYELSQLLTRIEECRDVFPETPLVYLIWADPEIGRLWYINQLLAEGKVDRVITRPKLPEEGLSKNTTFFESHNLRLGLNKIAKEVGHAYVIGHSSDILPHRSTYEYVVRQIQDGYQAVLFHWDNGIARQDVWHTNFFCIPTIRDYWPPLSPADEQDVLERQWGKLLLEVQPPAICKTHNYKEKRFTAGHLSESQPPWPIHPQLKSFSISLTTKGYIPWWRRIPFFNN